MRRLLCLLPVLLLIGCGPANSSAADDEQAPATPEALAAVALEHLDLDPSSFELPFEPPSGTVGVDVRFRAEPGEDGHLLRFEVGPGQHPPLECEKRTGGCATWETGSGTVSLGWDVEGDEDPGYLRVALQQAKEYQWVGLSGPSITGDPRDLDLQPAVAQLIDVLADDRFGLTTTTAMTAARLDGFPRPDDSDPAPLTPRALAVQALEQASRLDPVPTPEAAYAFVPEEYAGGEDVGVRIEFEGDVTLTALLDRRPHPGMTECPDGWTCVDPQRFVEVKTSEKRMAGYTEGAVRAVEMRRGYAGVAQWDGPAIRADDPAHLDFVLNQIVHALATEMAPRTTVSRVRDGEQLEIWSEREPAGSGSR